MCSYYFYSFKFMPPTNLQMYSLSNFYYGIVYICVVQGSCTLSYVAYFLLLLHPFYTLGYQYIYQPVLNVVCNACSHASRIRASVNTFRSSIRFSLFQLTLIFLKILQHLCPPSSPQVCFFLSSKTYFF